MEKIIMQLISLDDRAKEIIKKSEEDLSILPNIIEEKSQTKIFEIESLAKDRIIELSKSSQKRIEERKHIIDTDIKKKLDDYDLLYSSRAESWVKNITKSILNCD